VTPKQTKLLEMAEEKLAAAHQNAQHQRWRGVVSDAYYAMFDAARACLLQKGIEVSSHSECIGQFGREFAKTSVLPRELHRYLIDAFEARADADYAPEVEPDQQFAQKHLTNAETVVEVAKGFLN
jgi:hypothetical protein